MNRLAGKVAIVTGAARGMGLSHAREMIAEGAAVMMTDILEPGPEVAGLGENARFMHHDVTNSEEWDRLVEAAEAEFGPVGILVNNAGVSSKRSVSESSEADYRRVIDINQTSVFLGMKAVFASLRRAGGGSIINVSSTLGLVGGANHVAYTASKFAVRGMSKAAAAEFGPYGIRVNSVHPGGIVTPMTQAAGSGLDALFAKLPIPRRGQPKEVSHLVVFLASDESSYMTGAEFVIDGGWTCTW